MPSLNEIMQQAQKMQKKMQEAQQKLNLMVVTAEAVGGMVKVDMNGRHEVKSLYIDPSLLKDGATVVADLVKVAVNNAVLKVEELLKKEMVDLTKDLNIPPQEGEIGQDGA